jgi:hypothetical protein
VWDDQQADVLTGNSGRDWFFANRDGSAATRDQVVDRLLNEFSIDLDPLA